MTPAQISRELVRVKAVLERTSRRHTAVELNPTFMRTAHHLLLTTTAVAASMMLSATAQEMTTNSTANSAPALVIATNQIMLTVVKVDSEETAGENGHGTNAVDGNPNTFWHTQWQDANPECPHEIVIELTPPSTIKGFTYLPRQDDSDHGSIKDYECYVSNDGDAFGQPVVKGTFGASKEKKTVTFDPVKCRFIKLKALSEINDEAWTSAAEIGVVPND